ncbi:MAG: phage tail tape measure protein [Desulfotalea sp.]
MKNYALSFAIGAKLNSAFNSSLNLASNKVQGLGADLRGLTANKAKGDMFFKLRADLRKTEDEFTKAKNKAENLAIVLATTAKPTKLLQRQQAAAAKTAANLKNKLNDQRQKLVTVRNELDSAGISTKGLAKSNRELSNSIDKVRNSQKALAKIEGQRKANSANRDKLQGMGMGLGVAGVAMTIPAKLGIDFESTMADVGKVVDFKSPDGLKIMGDDILRMSTRIPMAASGLGEIVASAGQAGIAESELLGFTETAAKMGVAFDMGGKKSGDMMAGWRAGMSLNQKQTFDLADAVNHLSNKVKAEAADLGMVVQRTGALGKTAGFTTIQTASLGAAFIAVSEGPEVAATSMKNLMFAMTSGTSATKAQKDAFKALGLDAEVMAGKMQKDAVGAVKELMQEISKVKDEDKTALLTNLIGREGVAGTAALADNLDLLNKVFDETAKKSSYAGSMQDEFKARSDTTGNAVGLLTNKTVRLGIKLGTALLPAINFVVKPLGWLADTAVYISDKFPMATKVIGGLTFGAIGLGIGLVGLGYGFTFVQGGILRAQSMMVLFNVQTGLAKIKTIGLGVAQKGVALSTGLWTAGQWLLNAAMTANPIGLVVVGIGALIAGGIALYRNWDTVSAYGMKLWGSMKKIFSFTPLGLLITGFTKAKNFLMGIDWSASGAAIIGTLTAGIKSAAMAPVDAVSDIFTDVREYLPFSDAKKGPLSSLTASGMAIMTTLGLGVSGGGDVLAKNVENELGKSSLVAGGIAGKKGGGSSSASGSGINITFSPVIHVDGGSGENVKAQVATALHEGEARFKEMMKKFLADEKRLSYA